MVISLKMCYVSPSGLVGTLMKLISTFDIGCLMYMYALHFISSSFYLSHSVPSFECNL